MTGCYLTCLAFALILLTTVASPAAETPRAGGPVPDLKLAMPADRADRAYLGLPGWGGTFKIPDIKAQVVIIEIFSMYCPFCQKEAPAVNELYAAIGKDPALQGKVKLLGIGAGNSAFEVATFKKKYAVPFPLVPDPDYAAHKLCGEVRTPYFIAVKINGDRSQEIVHANPGSFGEIRPFLEKLRRAAGLTGGSV